MSRRAGPSARRPSCCFPADVADGRVRWADAMTVIDQKDGTCVPADGQALGEVIIRGDITMKGCLKDPDATQRAFFGGWFHSGDLAVLEPGGYLKIKRPG
jgi:fatty-acyl-CoA synthase